MLYQKNILAWEQALRVLSGVGIAAIPFVSETAAGWAPLAVWMAGGLGISLTGVMGFCPACYLVGRKPPKPANAGSSTE